MRSRHAASAALLIALPVFAGCLAEEGVEPTAILPGGVSGADLEALVAPLLVQSHDHVVAADHPESILGVERVGFAAGTGEGYGPDEYFDEIAVVGDRAYLARLGRTPGFLMYDIADPAEPELLAFFESQPAGDIEVSHDRRHVFLSTQRNGQYGSYGWNLKPGLGIGNLPRGAYVVFAEDPENVFVESFFPLPPNGPHTIEYYSDEELGRELVLLQTYDILFTTYPQNVGQLQATQKVVITELQQRPDGTHHLVPLSQYQRLAAQPQGESFFPHDTTVYRHPVTGQLLAYVAYWDLGMVILDITDPSKPVELSTFHDFSPSKMKKLHQVRQFPEAIGGKVVAVTEPEIPTGDETGQFTFVDVTDPKDPVKLGHWKLPGDLIVDEPFIFSPHNFEVRADGKLVLSHNHGGLWVLDVACDGCLDAPRAVGFYFPDAAGRENPPRAPGFPTAAWAGDYVLAPEYLTGLHVLRLT